MSCGYCPRPFRCSKCGEGLDSRKSYLQLRLKNDYEEEVYQDDLFCRSACLVAWLQERSYVITDKFLGAVNEIEDAIRTLKGPALI